jgi:hypothetical protein
MLRTIPEWNILSAPIVQADLFYVIEKSVVHVILKRTLLISMLKEVNWSLADYDVD